LLTVPIIIAIIAGIFLQPGLLLYLSTLANFVLTLLTIHITQKKDSRLVVKYLAPALVAAIPNLVSGTTEKYLEIDSKPVFTIETKVEDQQAHINLNVLSGRFTRFYIDYPVPGEITGFGDLNPVVDAKSTIKRVIDRPEGSYLDNAEITGEDMTLNANLKYIISYKPVTIQNMVFPAGGRDTYTIRYDWKYKDTDPTKTEWRSIQNDKIVDRPDVEIRNAYCIPYGGTPTQEGMSK
jgi:hypothetical protein